MARNTARISRAVPGAERKRTSENVPATATPAPMLPLTISITTHTMPGSSASVTAKLLVQSPQREYTSAMMSPSAIAAAKRRRN